MKYSKFIFFCVFLIFILSNSIIAQDESEQNKEEIHINYYLLFDWIREEPILEIPAEDITLYPFYIQKKETQEFTSYRHICNWKSIGADKAGLNISRIAGFESMYIVNNYRSLELKDFGKFVVPGNISFSLNKNDYIARSNSANVEFSSSIEDGIRTIVYSEEKDREIIIKVDQSKDDIVTYKKFLNNSLTMEAEISPDLSKLEIWNRFAGQAISLYKKNNDKVSLHLPGLSYKSKIDGNQTLIESADRKLSILTNKDNRIISIELESNNKTRYAKDFEFFPDYILTTEFDVIEGIITEKEIGYDDIIQYEIKKNVEDVVFSKYELNKDSSSATLTKYQSGREIVQYRYSYNNGIIQLDEKIYMDIEEDDQTTISYNNNDTNIYIYRNNNNVFTIKSNNMNVYNSIRGTGSYIKNSNILLSDNGYRNSINYSGIRENQIFNKKNKNINEVSVVTLNINVTRNHYHKENNYESIIVDNNNTKFNTKYEFRSGIGKKTIYNSLGNISIISNYDFNGNQISKHYNNQDIKWNSLYGYHKGKRSVIRDLVDGVLTYITLFRTLGDKLNIINYDSYSRRIMEKDIIYGVSNTVKLIGDIVLLTYENEKNITERIINKIKIPILSIIKKIKKIDFQALEVISEKSYEIGLTKYKENIINENDNFHKKIIDEKNNLYQKISYSNNREKMDILIYNGQYYKNALVKINKFGVPEEINIVTEELNQIKSQNFGFNYQNERNVDSRLIRKDIEILFGGKLNNKNTLNIYNKMRIKGLELYLDDEININHIKNYHDYILFIDNQDIKYYIKYLSNIPSKIYITDTENIINEIVYIKDFVHYAYQTFTKVSDSSYKSIIKDTLDNTLFNQDIILSDDKVEEIITKAGKHGEFKTRIEYNEKGLAKNRIINDSNGNKYKIEYLYGDNVPTNIRTYSVNDVRIGINVLHLNKDGMIIKEENYKYSMENDFWYNNEGKIIIIENKYNNIVDKRIMMSLSVLSQYEVYMKEFWFLYQIDF